jgi:hypothetical protein
MRLLRGDPSTALNDHSLRSGRATRNDRIKNKNILGSGGCWQAK